MTGSYCTFAEVIPQVEALVAAGADVIPIISTEVAQVDTRFGTADHWRGLLEQLTGKEPLDTIVDSEPIGPQGLLDVLVIAPCTGNTLSKLANAITDSPVLMAAKAHLRNNRPVVVAISTNDGLGANAKNLGVLLNARNIYMVPFGQDNPVDKACSLVADMRLIIPTIVEALQGKQIQPVLIQYKS
jgi:dipicolinate synthase subunit B